MDVRLGWPRRRQRRPRPAGSGAAGPSRTSQAVALTRAALARPHTPAGDPRAQERLCAGMRPARLVSLRAHLAARTRFFDDQVLAAIERGTSQVVILGAGYDDRALRFRAPGVSFFEVDHPATQADKRRRLAAVAADGAGPVLAAADFRADDVAAVLAGCGQDPGRATLFLCEGLLVYLDAPVITGLLCGLRARAAPGSVLAASLAIHPEGADTAAVLARANAARRTGVTEPWRTILPAAAHLALLAAAGWLSEAAVDDAELDSGAPPRRSLLVTARPGPAGRSRTVEA
ncbi:MAG TPA: class I SAM-dependent methyltransferase [Streptosporangiaceae bacterium]|nr:class I SAM-dependent methyltransferase [Streptosporangiaceae bacterium]